MINSSIGHKVIGYFSYSDEGDIFCDGDACIIAGTEELMHSYIKLMISDHRKRYIVKKTRFGEVIGGLELGGVYAFDKESYTRFFSLGEQCGISNLPEPSSFFLESSPTRLHFIKIQFDGYD